MVILFLSGLHMGMNGRDGVERTSRPVNEICIDFSIVT